jgi:cathepsin B
VKDTCWPYESAKAQVPDCRTTCTTTSVTYKKYRAQASTIKNFAKTDLTGVQNDLLTYGPVQTGYKVYDDFMTYKSGVYQHTTGDFLGSHAVTVIGWGTDSASGKKYWLVANRYEPSIQRSNNS